MPHQVLIILIHRSDDKPTTNKKKKAANKVLTPSTQQQIDADQAALSRRAERFQREREIERQKSGGLGGALAANKNLYSRIHSSSSRSASPSVWNTTEEPDPVRVVIPGGFPCMLKRFKHMHIERN